MTNLQAVQRPIAELPISARQSIPGSPDWVGIGSDAVWISNRAKSTVARLNPSTAALVATVHTGRAPCSGIAVGFDSVWSPSCTDHRVDRIDVRTNTVVATVATTIGDSEGGIAVSDAAVWVVRDQHGTLLHIDPQRNAIVGQVQTAPGSFVTAFGEGALWVTSTREDLVSRVDPLHDRLVTHI